MRLRLFLILLLPLSSQAFRFETALEDSVWKSESSPYVCKLEHGIDGYGSGLFEHIAGEEARLKIQGQGYAFDASEVKVLADPPDWRPNLQKRLIFDTKAVRGDVVVNETESNQVLAELAGGMQVVFNGQLEDSNAQPFYVFLSSVGFQDAFDEFKRCEDQLLPANYGQVERTRIQYRVGTIAVSYTHLTLPTIYSV